MNITKFRKTAIAGIAAAAFVAAGSLANPSEAQAGNGKIVAGVLGGLAVGAFFGAAHAHSYGPYYGTSCHFQKQQVWSPVYNAYVWQTVKVCY